MESKILGNWQVINPDDNDSPGVAEWGLYYAGTIKFYNDGSFKINLGTSIDDNTSKSGTWELDNTKSSVTLYSVFTGVQPTLRDTTQFNITIDPKERLILSTNWISITHKKLNN